MPGEQRIQNALQVIRSHVGPAEANAVDAALHPVGHHIRDLIGASLSLGNVATHEKRAVVRALILARYTKNFCMPVQFAEEAEVLVQLSHFELVDRLRTIFDPSNRGVSPDHNEVRDLNRSSWDPSQPPFTDPLNHTQNNYCYLVTAFTASIADVAMIIRDHTQPGKPVLQYDLNEYQAAKAKYVTGNVDYRVPITANPGNYGPYAQDPMGDGSRVTKKVRVDFARYNLENLPRIKTMLHSCSLISNAKHATYGHYGLILRVPKWNILTAFYQDQQFQNRAPDVVAEVQRLYNTRPAMRSLPTPTQLLNSTVGVAGSLHYNEVTVAGTMPGAKEVQIIGFFVKIDPGHNIFRLPATNPAAAHLMPQYMGTLMNQVAVAQTLPVIGIVDNQSVGGNVAINTWFPNANVII